MAVQGFRYKIVFFFFLLAATVAVTHALPGLHRLKQSRSDSSHSIEPPGKSDSVHVKKDGEVQSVGESAETVKYAASGSSFAPIVVVFDNPEDSVEQKPSKERVVVSDPKTVTGGSGSAKRVSEAKHRAPAPVIEMLDEGDQFSEKVESRDHGEQHAHDDPKISSSSSSSASPPAGSTDPNGTPVEPAQSRAKPAKPAEFYNFRKNHAARPQLPPHKTAAMRDFIAQNDLFNATFPCSSKEKSCLDEERVLYDADRNCYQLWRKGPCERGDWLVIDKKEATHGGGHFRAVCAPMRRCPERQVLMAFDQKCHSFAQIIREVCPKHEGLQLSYNVFGEGECKCDNCPPPQLPSNTFNEGRCAFPPSFYRSAVPEPEGLAEEVARMEAEEEEALAAEADVVAVPEAKKNAKRNGAA